VRKLCGVIFLLVGCATGRTYTGDRFEMEIAHATRVTEERGAKGTEWRFSQGTGRQFLGAAHYSVAGDPTFPCGVPEIEINGAPAYLVRRTLNAPHIEPPPVIEFSYLESDQLAREMVSSVKVRTPRPSRAPACEVVRTGGSIAGDTYDAGLFTARLLPGTWLLDSRHFASGDRNSLAGAWEFEEASTGKIFLSVHGYPRHPHVQPRCGLEPLLEFNGACASRCRDTDGLEPYPGPSNVTISLELEPRQGVEYVLDFEYDEHAPTARLAQATLESVRLHQPKSSACIGARTR
jgi:hypothetical protein